MSVIPPKLGKGEGKKKKKKLERQKKKRTSNNHGTASKGIIYEITIPEKGKEKEIFEVILLRTFQN